MAYKDQRLDSPKRYFAPFIRPGVGPCCFAFACSPSPRGNCYQFSVIAITSLLKSQRGMHEDKRNETFGALGVSARDPYNRLAERQDAQRVELQIRRQSGSDDGDVARRAGVSAMTVSRALKEEEAAFRRRRVNGLWQRSTNLAMCLTSLPEVYHHARQGSLPRSSPRSTIRTSPTLRAVSPTNWRIRSSASARLHRLHGRKGRKADEIMLRRRPEGIILTGGAHTIGRRMLESAGIPVVETWELPPKPIDQVVGFSNEEAMALLSGHWQERATGSSAISVVQLHAIRAAASAGLDSSRR